MANEAEKSHRGSCFCGAVEVEVQGEPAVAGICHCESCQRWHASPITAFALWPREAVRVVQGEESLGVFNKSGGSDRRWCTKCGGNIMNEKPEMGMVSVYATVLSPSDLLHRPQLHLFYAERAIDIPDGLPKYADVPVDFGGSGKLVEESA